MARGLHETFTEATGEKITRPLYLVQMGFATTLRYSSRAAVTFDSQTWDAAPITVDLSDPARPVLEVFNENEAFGSTVNADGSAGRVCKIWQAYQYSVRNLLDYSDVADGTGWAVEGSASVSAAADPFGGNNAGRVTGGTFDYQGITNAVPGGLTTSTEYVLSAFIKQAVSDDAFIGIRKTASGQWHGSIRWSFDGSGVPSMDAYVGNSYGFEPVGDGWHRVWVQFTSDASDTVGTVHIDPDKDATQETLDVYGVQVEQGAGPSNYQRHAGAVPSVPAGAPSGYTYPQLVFDGEMGPARIRDYVTIPCARRRALRTPRHYCVEPTFNHLPRRGTKFVTPNGTITLGD